MEFIIGLVVCVFVGWVVPQPAWAQRIIDRFK